MTYVDGFVIPVPEGNRDAYEKMARETWPVFRDHGALRQVEAWSDDVPDGKHTDFRRAVAAEAGEALIFSWIEWPDKATRDTGMKAAMEDPRMAAMSPDTMPFDGKRMIFGGFAPFLDAKAD